MTTAANVKNALAAFARPDQVFNYKWFFKTGPGEYGEGDEFIGVKVPDSRSVAKEFKDLQLVEIQKLLDSKVHEHRFVGLVILTNRFKKTKDAQLRSELFTFYLQNVYAQRINNWDLVDSTAPYLGEFLINRAGTDKLLNSLAKSESLWQRRTAVMFTSAFIREYRFDEILRLAKMLLNDDQDLIHKAVGWMLREVGNRETDVLREFLRANVTKMPRTMLRYSIEKFSESERKKWLTYKG
ncbi:MAG: hypothetical protein RLY88_677 [Actinomycetota bacterium]|jgi:3-methyladenine DNA glycosylase AlkD